MTALVSGTCDQAFEPVRCALKNNIAESDGHGQAVAIALDGQVVVDLWGGYADAARTSMWASDSLICMMSVGKAVAATCALHLIDRGALNLDSPVCRYWPEFAAASKQGILVRHILTHSAGLPLIDGLTPDRALNASAAIDALVDQTPLWEPGTQGGYHSYTYGFLVGEIVRRASGMTIGAYLRKYILPIVREEFYFGLNGEESSRTVEFILGSGNPLFAMMLDRSTLLGRSWAGTDLMQMDFNGPSFRMASAPSLNGHGTARFVARLYSLLARPEAGGLLSPSLAREMVTPQWEGDDLVLGWPTRMGLGLLLENSAMPYFGTGSGFGQPGANGAIGLGDGESGLGLCWCASRVSQYGLDDPQQLRILEAARQAMK